jgi:rhodanese-related sulfurtransferase
MSSHPDRIDPQTARDYLEEGRGLLIDARPRGSRAESDEALPDAVRIDPDAGAATDEQLLHLPRELTLIAFCDQPNQASSATLARRARQLGLGDASVLEGGMQAWKDAEFPIVPIIRRAPTGRLLETFSIRDLGRLWLLAFWNGAVDDRPPKSEESRPTMERVLGVVPREFVERYSNFLEFEGYLRVPDEHVKRAANLPLAVHERAMMFFGRAVALSGDEPVLASLLSDADSALLLRWYTWTEQIPRRMAWWHVEPTALVPGPGEAGSTRHEP